MTAAPLSARPSRHATLRRAWPLLLRPHRAGLGAALAVSLLAAGLQLGLPLLVGVATDAVAGGDRERLSRAAVAAAAVAGVSFLAVLGSHRLIARAGESFLATVRTTTAERLLARPLPFFDGHAAGELVARATTDVATLSSFVREWLPMLVRAVLLLVVTLGVLFAASWQLALLTLVYLPGLVIVAVRFRRAAGPAHAAFAAARGHSAAVAHETVSARSWIQGLGAGDGRAAQIATADAELFDATSAALRADLRTSVLQFLQQLTLALVLFAGGLLVQADTISVGTVATFALALRQLYQPLDTLGIAYGALEGARAELARVVEVVTSPPLRPPTIGRPPGARQGLALAVSDVSYTYDGEAPALDRVDLQIAAGEHVALVGPTGSGKSTLARVLAGLYPPHRGRVVVGGHDVAEWPPEALRQAVVLIPQEVHVLAGTVADNLRLVPGEHDDRALEDAIERAGLSSWVDALPHGLATDVGAAGERLSAGERQLLAIARAVLADPAVLILDEATADVDPHTERLLDDALARSSAGRTTVVVAHRAATALRAGRRIELEAGRVSRPSSAAPRTSPAG